MYQFILIRSTILSILLTLTFISNLNALTPNEKESFIERFYSNILGREADNAGLNYWLNRIENESATTVALGFFNSNEFRNMNLTNEEFINILYKTMFNREADAGGRASWLEKMNRGRSKQSIMFGFFNSPEFNQLSNDFGVTAINPSDKPNLTGVEAYVNRFYDLVLKRGLDEGGLDYWTKEINNESKSVKEVAKDFIFSQEYLDQNVGDSSFIETCYQAFFNRKADREGKLHWQSILNYGGTREDIFNGFVNSPEFIFLVDSFNLGEQDTTIPIFITSPIISVDENQIEVLTVEATDNSIVRYMISGIDSTLFNINSSTGELTFISPSDYETKPSYSLEVRAIDESSNVALLNLTVNINNSSLPVLSSTNKTFNTFAGKVLPLEIITATDDNDGTILVTQTGNVDFDTIGTYNIIYSATDSDNNTSSIEHTYVVKGKPIYINNRIIQLPTYFENFESLKIPNLSNSSPENLTRVKDKLYFTANDGKHGKELWISDGTKEGTKLLKNIDTSGHSHLRSFTAVGDKLYFASCDEKTGKELWVSDGTTEGTKLLKFTNGEIYYISEDFTVIGNKLYFKVNDNNDIRQLWVTEGTKETTVFIKQLTKSIRYQTAINFKAINNRLYFTGENSNGGISLFFINTTGEEIKEIEIPTNSIYDLHAVGNNLYFTISRLITPKDEYYNSDAWGERVRELWVTDGTNEGTKIVKYINKSGASFLYNFTESENKLYFTANDGKHGKELWVSDGTEDGTHIVKDIVLEGDSDPSNLSVIGNKLYFNADGALWVSDGTNEGTKILKNARPYAYYGTFLTEGDKIYFQTDSDKVLSYNLWVSDGTEEGTKLLKEYTSKLEKNYVLAYKNKLYFTSYSETDGGNELWVSDGTKIGTKLLDINIKGSSNPKDFSILNEKLYFSANDGINGRELWVSDGTEAGTTILKDINNTSYTLNTIESEDKIFFINQEKLWVSDGTQNGTKALKKLQANLDGYTSISMNGKIYFSGDDGINGRELWVSDGTENGTKMVRDINYGIGSSYPSDFVKSTNQIYFKALDKDNNRYLWMSDGTKSGTKPIKKEGRPLYAYHFEFGGNLLYFSKNSNLWVTDKTEDSSNLLKELDYISDFTIMKNKLYFSGRDVVVGSELWVSDGTIEGTQIVKDLYNKEGEYYLSNGTYPTNLTVVSNKIFFVGNNEENYDATLYKSDGTEEGTLKVKNFINIDRSNVDNLEAVGKNLYFTIFDELQGYVVWMSDGTEEGTIPLYNKYPGFGNFYKPFLYNDKVYNFAYSAELNKSVFLIDNQDGSIEYIQDIPFEVDLD